jgi:predicted  nucleic acid-binding Zn-ribbon protein
MGCHSGPVFTDAAYRAIEREADRNSAELAVTGADIAAGVERIEEQTARVASELEDLETAIGGSGLPDVEKDALLYQAAIVREENSALRGEVNILREDAVRLNDQLVEEREIRAALSKEHDRLETAAVTVQIELGDTKEDLAKVKGQRNTFLAILITAGVVVVLFIVFKVLRAIKIIPI